MTTVTINDTAADEAALATGAQLAPTSDRANPDGTAAAADVVNADKSVITTDSRGRKITFKKLRSLDRFRAAGVLGEQSMNLPYMAMASVAFSVTKIDEHTFGQPLSIRELEGMISILDDEGMEAVNKSYDKHFSTAVVSGDEVRDAVKN